MRRIFLFMANACVMAYFFYGTLFSIILYRPDNAEFNRFVAFMGEIDALIAEGNFTKLDKYIVDTAVFEYVFTDKYGKKSRRFADKKTYLKNGSDISKLMEVTVKRDIVSYALYKNGDEAFLIAFTTYRTQSGRRSTAMQYREHIHLRLKDGDIRLSGIYSENKYNRFYPSRP